ncbi:hypothetical protein NMY22_g17797 [Coprinellus aureogranulatus]|nr:hypothetical protein NMY22_g17797 [Coprinellus aureogranulatus]
MHLAFHRSCTTPPSPFSRSTLHHSTLLVFIPSPSQSPYHSRPAPLPLSIILSISPFMVSDPSLIDSPSDFTKGGLPRSHFPPLLRF